MSNINIDIKKLVTVDNYNAGSDGNLLICVQDRVTPISIIGHKSTEKEIDVLLCTATITDKKMLDELGKMVDDSTPCNRVIVVSNKFMKMSNKKQLALLEIENGRAATKPDTNVDGQIMGEVSAIEKFGKWCTYRAINKARKVREKSTKKATRWMHHDYKKDCKAAEKLAKAVETIVENKTEEQEQAQNPA